MSNINEQLQQLKKAAKGRIERRDQLAYDAITRDGQIFDNVKHMSWALFVVALEMTKCVKKWQHLNDHMENKALVR